MTRYKINGGVTFRIADGDAVVASVSPAPIPVATYEALLRFRAGATFAEAFAATDAEMTFQEYREAFDRFVELGILTPIVEERELQRRLRAVWNRAIFEDEALLGRLQRALSAGRVVALRDAFATDFAEQVHEELAAYEDWHPFSVTRDTDFHFNHHNIYERMSPYPPLLSECRRLFGSQHMKDRIGSLSGVDTQGPTILSASYYMPGDYSLPHDDTRLGRAVAFVWYVTKAWQRSWGGQFFWCRTATYLQPTFNTLLLFVVNDRSSHFVCPVAPHATGQRLAVNGWWTKASASGKVRSGKKLPGVDREPLVVEATRSRRRKTT